MKVADEGLSSQRDLSDSLQELLEQMLEQSCAVLSKDESLQLNTRLEELDNFGSSIVDLLSQVFSSLLRKLEVLNSKVALNLLQKDYEVLEQAVQKCEGEIRKHIRIEQQLKLYSDSLEEKLEGYEKIVESEKVKCARTSEVTGQTTQLLSRMEKENKELQLRVRLLEREHDGDATRPKKHSKIMSEVSFQENTSSNNLRQGLPFNFEIKKRRRNIEKINLRSKPLSREKSRADYGEFQVAIDCRRDDKDLLKKRHSVNINALKEKMLGVKPYRELLDMHRTLNVSQDSDKRRQQHSKKRHTEVASSTALRKQARSNSVCK